METYSLNPCCSGIWSETHKNKSNMKTKVGLNPCCSGIWSETVFNIINRASEELS